MLCFGVLKDFFGGERDVVELGEGARVGELVELLRGRGGVDSAVWGALAVAVNREYAGVETVLRDGDEVALLPPVSGGIGAGSAGPESLLPMSQNRDMGHPEILASQE